MLGAASMPSGVAMMMEGAASGPVGLQDSTSSSNMEMVIMWQSSRAKLLCIINASVVICMLL